MRYVIALDTALRLVRERTTIPAQNRLVAPTVLKSQVLSHLYASVRRGEFDRAEAVAQLDHLRSLNIRLLGDGFSKVAWNLAEKLEWPDTLMAEYVALTKLQADAFVSLDRDLTHSLKGIVPLASIKDMLFEQAQQGTNAVN